MNPRDEKKRLKDEKKKQKFAESLKIKPLLEIHATKTLPLRGKPAQKTISEQFEKDNPGIETKVVGGNNVTLLLLPKKTPQEVTPQEITQPLAVTVFPEFTQSAIEAKERLKNAPWMSKEYGFSRSVEDAKYYQKRFKTDKENYPEDINQKNAMIFAAVAINEVFEGGSLDARADDKQDLSENDRINLACQVGLQLCRVIEDLEAQRCVWVDLKPGNILLRSDGSIGVPDFKAFFPYEKMLVEKATAYNKQIVKNQDDFDSKREALPEGICLFFQNSDGSIQYAVKDKQNETVSGVISREALNQKFDQEAYNVFSDKLGQGFLNDKAAKILYGMIAEKQNTISEAYRPGKFCFKDMSNYMLSNDFIQRYLYDPDPPRYESPEIVRKTMLGRFNQEYSWQLAATLYFTATGKTPATAEERRSGATIFDFNHDVFNPEKNPDGAKLKTLIDALCVDQPDKRQTYREAFALLEEIKKNRPELNVKEEQREPQKLTRRLSRTFSKSLIKEKKITTETTEKHVQVKEAEPEKNEVESEALRQSASSKKSITGVISSLSLSKKSKKEKHEQEEIEVKQPEKKESEPESENVQTVQLSDSRKKSLNPVIPKSDLTTSRKGGRSKAESEQLTEKKEPEPESESVQTVQLSDSRKKSLNPVIPKSDLTTSRKGGRSKTESAQPMSEQEKRLHEQKSMAKYNKQLEEPQKLEKAKSVKIVETPKETPKPGKM